MIALSDISEITLEIEAYYYNLTWGDLVNVLTEAYLLNDLLS